MAGKARLIPAIALLLQAAIGSLHADDETPETKEPSAAAETASSVEKEAAVPDYYFELREDGTPLFRQVISWREVPHALAYELILVDSEGVEIIEERTSRTDLTISLPPGSYRYRITVYNLLDKPEIRTDWEPIEVVKAEIPEIEGVSPAAIYMEEANFKVTVRGTNLLPDAEYSLVDPKTNDVVLEIDEKTTEDDETILFLPERKIDFGDYLVRVVNPGGISDVSEGGFVVRYQKPVDFFASVGFAPSILLYDDWVRNNWPKTFYPGGVVSRVGLFVMKRRWGYLGPEVQAHLLLMKGGTAEAAIISHCARIGLNCAYKYIFSPRLQAVARVGCGVSLNNYAFDYEGTEGPRMTSADLFLTAGIAMQYHFNKRLYLEAGGDLYQTFHHNYSEGNISPFVALGFYR